MGEFSNRPKLYYNVDGMGEIGIGLMCLGFALLGWMQLHSPPDSAWHRTYVFFIYLTALSALLHYGPRAFKERVTYRRTGFVEYRPVDQYWIPIGIALVLSALFGAALYVGVRRGWQLSMSGSLVALVFAAGYVRIAMTARWKWATFLLMVGGALAIALLPPNIPETFANNTSLTSAIPARVVGTYWLTFVLLGILMLVSGGISLWLYLRSTQGRVREAR